MSQSLAFSAVIRPHFFARSFLILKTIPKGVWTWCWCGPVPTGSRRSLRPTPRGAPGLPQWHTLIAAQAFRPAGATLSNRLQLPPGHLQPLTGGTSGVVEVRGSPSLSKWASRHNRDILLEGQLSVLPLHIFFASQKVSKILSTKDGMQVVLMPLQDKPRAFAEQLNKSNSRLQ